jgi:hypothetical protein
VISFRRRICEGLPREVRENQDVITAYLGVVVLLEIKGITVHCGCQSLGW